MTTTTLRNLFVEVIQILLSLFKLTDSTVLFIYENVILLDFYAMNSFESSMYLE